MNWHMLFILWTFMVTYCAFTFGRWFEGKAEGEALARERRLNDVLVAHSGCIEKEMLDRWKESEAIVDSINTQLREHGIDMQFDPEAFYSKR